MAELPDRFLFEVEGVTSTLRVARFAGHEALSELFRFEVLFATEEEIDVAAAIGAKALLTMLGDDGTPRHVHGIVARLEIGESGKKLSLHRATVVPKAFRLLHRHDVRIFQELSADQIITRVLEGAGLAAGTDFRLTLQGTYATREYCVQYRESDWAFVSRLMEEEGLFYFFEHEEGKHVLVLGDKSAAHPAIAGEATVKFRTPLGALTRGEHVSRLQYAEALGSGKVSLRDWDFKRPGLKLEGELAGRKHADLAIYDYPGELEQGTVIQARAQARLEARQAPQAVAEGESGCMRLAAGHTFTLSEHARDALNRGWLLTRVEHEGVEPLMAEADIGEGDRYVGRFECIPDDVAFRPPQLTPRPSVKGVQSAIVVGPAGEEIHVDEHGRVKVQFHWDRLGKNDDKSSCWIRVSQGWAGEGWGAMFIPRVGHEVLVDFIDGDPDRPILVGRVYHGTNVPPYALPAEKTKSTIKSNSSPGGGGFNELRFEDKAGSEEIFLHGQKDWTIQILNDKNQSVGHDETRQVGNDRTVEVGNDQAETIGHDETFAVKNDRTKSVGRDEAETIGRDRTIEVGRDHTESIGQNLTLSVAKVRSEDIGEDSSETTGKSKSLTVGTDYTVEVSGGMSTTVKGSQAEDVKAEKTITVAEKLTITVGSATVTVEKNGNVTIDGAKLTVTGSGDVKVESSGGKVEVKASGDVKVEASGKVELKSSGATDVNASGPVKLKGANVAIN